jgi:hypothetical protein
MVSYGFTALYVMQLHVAGENAAFRIQPVSLRPRRLMSLEMVMCFRGAQRC